MKQSLYPHERQLAMENWQNLQFGMFIHFGLYSLAGGCWNSKPVKRGYCEQILSHGNIPQADYEALMNEFYIPQFNAECIVRLAKAAGMRYIVLTSKHHDGFCLFNTKTTDYNTVHAACKRDLVGELSAACKKEGLAFGVYFSLIDWHCPYALPISSHNSDRIPDKHHAYNLMQLTELLTNYGDICELWLDMGHPTATQSQEMYELVHRLQKRIMINGRIWNDRGDFATLPDNEIPELPADEYELNVPWQTPASIYKETWGYKSWQERGNAAEKIEELTTNLRRVVSTGGNYLLNIGPDPQGAVIAFEREVLEGIGRSLRETPLAARKVFFGADKDESDYESSELPAGGGEHSKSFFRLPNYPLIQAETDSSFNMNICTKLFRYTGEDYYSLRPIVTGKRWRLQTSAHLADEVYLLGWKSGSPLTEDLKLCFEDENKRLYFSLAKGKTRGVISSDYRLPCGRSVSILELSTVGSPLERAELALNDIEMTLVRR